MSTRAYPSAVATLSIALWGAAVTGGCAIIYNFSDYTAANAGTGGGVSSGSGGSGAAGGGAVGLPPLAWAQRFGGTQNDVVGRPGVDVSPQGDVFITGVFEDSTVINKVLKANVMGFFLAKLDGKSGIPAWSVALANTTSGASSLAATPDGGVVVCGSFDIDATPDGTNVVPANSSHDIFLAKFDEGGGYVWGREFGDTEDQFASAVAVDKKGMVYLTGRFSGKLSFGKTTLDAQLNTTDNGFIAQFDSAGNNTWALPFGAPAEGHSLAVDSDGVALGGSFMGTLKLGGQTFYNPTTASFVSKVDASGKVLFTLPILGQDVHVASNPSTGGAFYGLSESGAPGGNMATGELDKAGKPLWQEEYSGTAQGVLESIDRVPSGDLFITGYSMGDLELGTTIKHKGMGDVFLARLNSSGKLRGGVGFGDAEPQFGRNVRVDASGNLYLYGDFQGSVDFGQGPLSAMSVGTSDVFIAKFIAGP